MRQNFGMRGLAVLFTAAAATLALVAPASAQALGSGGHTDTQALLDRYLTHAGPGAAVFAGNRTSTWDVYSGTATIAANQPIQPNDQFRIGSQSKTFTSLVVLQLVDEGKIDLDAPIERYLPAVVDGNGYDGTKISVRQILQHTSGIARDATNPKANPDGSYSLRELVRAGLANPPQFAPGTSWAYSNVNFYVAGMLIEQITGMSAGDAITTRIIQPLGLTRTRYPRPADRSLDAPYLHGYGGGRLGPFFFWYDTTFSVEPSVVGTAGAMASTQQDMVAFDQAIADGKVVSVAALAQMRKAVPIPGTTMGYGLGLWRIDLPCGGLGPPRRPQHRSHIGNLRDRRRPTRVVRDQHVRHERPRADTDRRDRLRAVRNAGELILLGLQGSRRRAPPGPVVHPVMLAEPVSMWPANRRDHVLSADTVTVKSYQPLL